MKDVQVGATAYFWDSTWAGGLDLAGARLHKVVLGFPPERVEAISSLKLENAVIDRVLSLENLKIGRLEARKLAVKDGAEFTGVTLDGADLRDSAFSALNFHKTTWPRQPEALWLEGVTYQSLGAGADREGWQALLASVGQRRYDTRNYGLLETLFQAGRLQGPGRRGLHPGPASGGCTALVAAG